jgi:hypothetical protein
LVPTSDVDLGQHSRCSAATNYLETIANVDFWTLQLPQRTLGPIPVVDFGCSVEAILGDFDP